jgi:hypothetical protein
MSRTIEALREEIETAFAARSHPGDEAIVLRRPGCEGSEPEAVWQFFHGRSWREITLDEMKARVASEDIFFLTLDGFVDYLPAFLIFALDLDDRYGLDGPVVSQLWTWPEEIAARLAPSEKRAVVHFLDYVAGELERRWPGARNDAQAALDHYWAYFTDAELGLTEP